MLGGGEKRGPRPTAAMKASSVFSRSRPLHVIVVPHALCGSVMNSWLSSSRKVTRGGGVSRSKPG